MNNKIINIDLSAGFSPIRYPAINNQLCYNFFDYEGAMVPTPGYKLNIELNSDGEARGLFYSESRQTCIAVIDDDIFEVSDGNKKLLGSINTLKGRVYFAENTVLNKDSSDGATVGQIGISDGQNIYVLNLNNEVYLAVDDNGDSIPFTPGIITYQNSYFFVNDLSSDKIYASNINDAGTWPELNYSTISALTTGCAVFKTMLLVFGKDITEIFYGSTSSTDTTFFPYTKNVSQSWEYGCLSPETLDSTGDYLAFLATSKFTKPIIVASRGGSPKKISNSGIDALMNDMECPSDSEGFFYTLSGHTFYQINFLTDNISFLYDFTTEKWFSVTEKTLNSKHSIRKIAFLIENNKMLAISNDSGNLFEVDLSIFTQDGNVIPRSITTQNYVENEEPFSIHKLDVQIEQGENENTSKVCLSLSKDRGRTYRIFKTQTLDGIGSRQSLLDFRQLGNARWWTFKLDFFSQDRFIVLGAAAYL